jgi:hypothetical protein
LEDLIERLFESDLFDHLWLSLTWEGGQRVLDELIRTMTSAGHRIEPLETMEDTAIKLIQRRIAC